MSARRPLGTGPTTPPPDDPGAAAGARRLPAEYPALVVDGVDQEQPEQPEAGQARRCLGGGPAGEQ